MAEVLSGKSCQVFICKMNNLYNRFNQNAFKELVQNSRTIFQLLEVVYTIIILS
jgi:hypothetical protein